MNSTFYRLQTDGIQLAASLDDSYAGPFESACWLIGGGPSLSEMPHAEIAASPIPKMVVNLAGTHLLRPTFWTSYDPSVRFHRSVYLDPGIVKFVHKRRAMDLVPETTYKVCECPNTYFFERDGQRGFHNYLSREHPGIVDWADSMVQAIDILYRLGFRTIYLAGCEMRVRLSAEQLERAARAGVRYQPPELLNDFLKRAGDAGVSAEEFEELPAGPHYHFDEQKPVRAAANTDSHYFRISQYLRLSRRSLSLAGVRLISVTPGSRLNDYFPYRRAEDVLEEIHRTVGDPRSEDVSGRYQQIEPRHPDDLGPMRDFRPHNWKSSPTPTKPEPVTKKPEKELIVEGEGFQRLQDALKELDRADLVLDERG